jgi:N6-L-threonylcarbamoyladenine synthase
MIILGIETSCDETAASVIRGEGDNVEILSNVVSSQIEIHKKWGGVIPEVAAREHVLNILPVINEALEKAGLVSSGNSKFVIRNSKLGIDAIAVTTGPGLITSLIVGVETAKTLAYAWGVPLIGVNHIEGHIYANFINEGKSEKAKGKRVDFPTIILTVSGGHNLLVLMQGHGKFKIIGETLDDAAGEAFDKAAQILGLGYPGGPAISAAAEKFSISNFQFLNNDQILNFQNKKSIVKGQLSKVVLPRPMLNSKNYDFSFSGLKTALLYQVQKDKNFKNRISEYAAEFQQAVIDTLIHKTLKAAKDYKAKTIMLAGGVSANKELRIQMEEAIKLSITNYQLRIPDLRYTTDNAAMIACAGYFWAKKKQFVKWEKIKADCNQKLK